MTQIKLTRWDTRARIFCGARPTTGEHVMSHWTHPLLPERPTARPEMGVSIEYLNGKTDGGSFKTRAVRDWKVKCVCQPRCNGGWMKTEIEDPAIPILTPLIRGEEKRLFAEDLAVIARWAVLKTMVANHRAVQPQ